MPARIARSNVSATITKNVRNKNQKRNLDAFSIAAHTTQDKRKVRQHRLGEILDDGPRHKRRRIEENDNEEDEDDEDARSQPAVRHRKRPENENDVEQGSDSSGNEWTLGGLADDDDDSDLDSDEAFGESDEEKFEGFTFRGSSKGARRPVNSTARKIRGNDEVDLSEDEGPQGESDDFGEEGVDLATMLDGTDDGEDENRVDEQDSESEDGDEASSSDESEDENDFGDLDEERLARLRDRLEVLDNTTQSTSQPTLGKTGVLSIDDLLAELDPSAKSQFHATLKPKKKSAKPVTLTAPLPKRQQDKLDRELATAKAKEQLDRWRDTVMHNRRAEFLSFPLKDPSANEPLGKEKFISAAPQTDLEQNIQRIMVESGMSTKLGKVAESEAEALLLKAEELATNKLPVEEVERRRADLRRARDLVFREEIKAKRIAKIKSKSYRRVHRKEREREAQKEREAAEAAGIPLDEGEAEKFDRKRAEERMSTKHRESKWAKSLKATNRTVWDDGARDSVYDQARRNEELKQRIAGSNVHDDESSSNESDENDDNTTTNLNQLEQLRHREAPDQGLSSMKFMRAADAKRRAQNDEDVARIRKDLAIEDGDDDSESEIDDQGLGRAIFGPKVKNTGADLPAITKPEMEEDESSGEELERREQAERGVASAKDETTRKKSTNKAASKDRSSAEKPPVQARPLEDVTSGDGNAWLYSNATKKAKKDKARESAVGDDDIIAVDIVTEVPKEKGQVTPRASGVKATVDKNGTEALNRDDWQTVQSHRTAQDRENDTDEESSQNAVTISTGPKASYQSRAFAGDDVALAFQAEKEAAEASEDEKEISTHLPGWGSWTGENLSKSLRKANNRQKHNPLYKTKLPGGVNREHRKDKGRENVIISEKTDRKGRKFLAPVLPHQYATQTGGKDIYERSLRVPMGPEWSTKEVFQRNTRPRVIVKKGTVIEALEKPLV